MDKGIKKISREELMVGVGIGLLIFAAVVIIGSFVFLVNDVLPAINPDNGSSNNAEIHFNLQGFDDLGL